MKYLEIHDAFGPCTNVRKQQRETIANASSNEQLRDVIRDISGAHLTLVVELRGYCCCYKGDGGALLGHSITSTLYNVNNEICLGLIFIIL